MPSSSSGPRPCNWITDLSPGGVAAARIRVGDNGSGGSSPEYSLTAGGGTADANIIWDPDLSDGLDSGWVEVEMTVEAGGDATLTIGGSTIARPGVPGTTVGNVQIKASATGEGCAFTFRAITVRYYSGGTLRDTVVLQEECHPSSSGAGSATVEVRPTEGGSDKVVINAQVCLTSTSTTPPSPDAMAGDIHVFAGQ